MGGRRYHSIDSEPSSNRIFSFPIFSSFLCRPALAFPFASFSLFPLFSLPPFSFLPFRVPTLFSHSLSVLPLCPVPPSPLSLPECKIQKVKLSGKPSLDNSVCHFCLSTHVIHYLSNINLQQCIYETVISKKRR